MSHDTEVDLHRAGIFRSSVLVGIVNYIGVPLLVVYSFAMFVFPWIGSQGRWGHVQEIWDRWQTFNAGALAFLASLIAFNISKFNENQQREREFVAAKAFLPSTLSALMDYCSRSASIYGTLWGSDGSLHESFEIHDIPNDYKEVFNSCIRHADADIVTYLSNILIQLQVHDARLRDALAQISSTQDRVLDKYTLIAYLYRLGELYSSIGNLSSFARGEEAFKSKPLSWEDFLNAYSILNLAVKDFFIDEKMNLRAFTIRALKRIEDQTSEGVN